MQPKQPVQKEPQRRSGDSGAKFGWSLFSQNRNGVELDQEKEPAFSRELISFLSSKTISCPKLTPPENPAALGPDQLIRLVREAGIRDERDGRALWKKLDRWKQRDIRAIVCDAIDDEPYISSQMNPLMKCSREIVFALNLLGDVFAVKERYIAVYKNMYDLGTKIPSTLENVPVRRLGGKYPMESRTAKVLERDHVLVGACALLHLYRAVTQGIPQTTAIITVAGNCVGTPTNLEVSLGTPLSQVLDRCGLVQQPTHIVEGGAMKGLCIIDPEHTVIRPSTRAVLAFRDDKKERHYRCIGCGRCVDACPMDLNPALLYQSLRTHHIPSAKRLGLRFCCGCSTCSYICPSKLELSHTIYTAKGTYCQGEREDDDIDT